MDKNRAMILFLAMVAIVAVAALPCHAAQNDDKNIWTEGDDRGPRPGTRPGFGPGRGPGRERFELTDEEIDRIMDGLKQRSPEKAKELAELRKKDPEKFREELGRNAREEFRKVVGERIEKLEAERRARFLEWLATKLPEEAEELAKLKERSPDLYGQKYELVWRKYGRIYEEGRRNPELEKVLIEDLRLQKRRDQLLGKIHATTNQTEKEKLTKELEEVIGNRYDLIVRRKQIAYEWLLKRLEELQNRVKESRAEIRRAQDPKVKAENVEKRKQDLLAEKKGFTWD
jgi:hypothetical protein